MSDGSPIYGARLIADRLRRYCRAMEDAYGDHPDTGAWIEWVRDRAATLDPLREAPTEPDPVESTPEELQRHLPDGWRVEARDLPITATTDGGVEPTYWSTRSRLASESPAVSI
jgi:hypothetical protein